MIGQWKINQTITGFIIAFGGFGFGCGLAWTATALPNLEESGQIGRLSPTEKSWIGSLLAIGALIGCPIAGFLMGGRGRKICFWSFSAVGFAGWAFLACATSPLYVYCGRLLTGISVGGYTILVPIYVGEIASKENRGLIGSFFLIMLYLGKLFSNVVGIAFSAHFASVLCAIQPLLYGILLLLIPESPTMLLKQNKKKDAYKSLCWLEATGFTAPHCCFMNTELDESPEILAKLENIKLGHATSGDETNSKVTVKEFFSSPESVKPVLLIVIEMLLAQFCGINVSTFYTIEIFEMSGEMMMIDSEMATVILAIIQTIGCLACSIFVDKYGRKVLLMSSFFAMGSAMGGFTLYFYINDVHPTLLSSFPLLSLTPLISLIIYNLAYSWGVGSIVWILMSEILPQKFIGPASAIANATFWGSAFMVTQAFQMFKQYIPLHIWFLLFSIVSFIGCLFNGVFLPETKGFTFQEIQGFFNKKKHNTTDL